MISENTEQRRTLTPEDISFVDGNNAFNIIFQSAKAIHCLGSVLPDQT